MKDYPFLKAALEDVVEVQLCLAQDPVNRRHIVCLMFDALEFVLYETLLLYEKDIYRTGQNTIGFDDALAACQGLHVEIPQIGVIRQIEKLRGDAKHHAQTPSDQDYQRLVANFDVVLSRLIHEQFEGVLGSDVQALPLLSHQVALFESYRRRRNHDWERAYRLCLGAMLRKHREMFGNLSERVFAFSKGPSYQLGVLGIEIDRANYSVAPQEAATQLKNLISGVQSLTGSADWQGATELIASAYSVSDKLLPGIFSLDGAKRLTERLYQPERFKFGKSMAWAKAYGRQGSDEARLTNEIEGLLLNSPELVRTFGQPHYETDDDRYWKWWEFAIFDNERWHSFHLDTSYHVSLETGPDLSSDRKASADLLKLIFNELSECKRAADSQKNGPNQPLNSDVS